MQADPYASLASRFEAHYDSVRGAVRTVVVSRQLDSHLPETAARIVDVGGGTGRQGIRLARMGHQVVVLEPSAEMLTRAQVGLDQEPADVRSRVTLVQGTAEDGPALLGEAQFNVVLCHAVVLYVEDPGPIVRAIADL